MRCLYLYTKLLYDFQLFYFYFHSYRSLSGFLFFYHSFFLCNMYPMYVINCPMLFATWKSEIWSAYTSCTSIEKKKWNQIKTVNCSIDFFTLLVWVFKFIKTKHTNKQKTVYASSTCNWLVYHFDELSSLYMHSFCFVFLIYFAVYFNIFIV